MTERLLTKPEVAEMCRVPIRTMDRWRYLGTGPKGFRVGKKIVYRESDVEAWLAEREKATAAGGGPEAA